jgi:predicted RNA-binding Zn-ribbon protein involved in translation (DUF1610 family)
VACGGFVPPAADQVGLHGGGWRTTLGRNTGGRQLIADPLGSMMAKLFNYFDKAWRSDSFACPSCAWNGPSAAMTSESHKELMDFSCPQCDKMILIVSYPTLGEISRAAQSGNTEAQSELVRIRQHGKKRELPSE